MEQAPVIAPVVKAEAFASGLQRNIAKAGRHWSQWSGGAHQLALTLACVERVVQCLQHPEIRASDGAIGECVTDLRTILEWTTYQSSTVAAARAIGMARRTRAFAERFGLVANAASGLAMLIDSETALIENIRARNGHMQLLAGRAAHLGLPEPLVDLATLARTPRTKPRTLALIQALTKSQPSTNARAPRSAARSR